MSLAASILPGRSQLGRLTDPGAFVWATGIEDTVITAPWPATGRTLDEYALTGHYRRWAADLALIAGLGVRAARYGVPWHRVNPAPGRWDWTWADRCLGRLLDLGVAPIVDLLHYGLPSWMPLAYLDPAFPERFADFAKRLASRFRGRIRWYTPVNEPRITAWYCGRLGWWPPGLHGWRGFVAVALAVARATCMSVAALREVDGEIVDVHVDATDTYTAEGPDLSAAVTLRRGLVFLSLDLVTGRVVDGHPLRGWLLAHGASRNDLTWLADHSVGAPGVVGINLYPLYSHKVLSREGGRLRVRAPYGSPALVEDIAEAYWRRYGRPVMITETASAGSVAKRLAWLNGSVAAVRALRSRGIPLIGYTWWPLFSLVSWSYRQGLRPVADHLVRMGLWDLDGRLDRLPTPLVDIYAALAAAGTVAVGPLSKEPRHVP